MMLHQNCRLIRIAQLQMLVDEGATNYQGDNQLANTNSLASLAASADYGRFGS
jgi:hypothetical protein